MKSYYTTGEVGLKIGYADPPYIGCAHRYADQPDYSGEIDHAALIERLYCSFDGWILHGAASAQSIRKLALLAGSDDIRWCAWVKGFAAFKRNIPVAYAWEPVLIKACRKPEVSSRIKPLRDWIECPITLRRGLVGAKPEKVCHWAFEVVGANPDDELIDIFPGTGAVSRAWDTWRRQYELSLDGEIIQEPKS